MKIEFRNCEYNDLEFILHLKELCFKWYIEVIYGWDINIQKELTKKELNEHINDMKIITLDNKDIGITTFYEENDAFVVGMIMIDPNYQRLGIATNIIKEYISIAKNKNKKIILKTYKENPARKFYERLGFKIYNEDKTHIHMVIE